jgi:hypothetical protein
MKKNPFLWLILVFCFLYFPPPTLLDAEALSGSSGGGNLYNFVLLFSIVVSGACLIGLCLIAYFRKE